MELISTNSSSCSIAVSYKGDAQLDPIDYETKSILYSFMLTSIAVIQLIAALKLLKDITNDERSAG